LAAKNRWKTHSPLARLAKEIFHLPFTIFHLSLESAGNCFAKAPKSARNKGNNGKWKMENNKWKMVFLPDDSA
jgi:hypothetical protein